MQRVRLWMGGNVPLGCSSVARMLRVVPEEAETVRFLFALYEQLGTMSAATEEAAKRDLRSKRRTGRDGGLRGGAIMGRGQIHHVLSNPVYAGRIRHKTKTFAGRQPVAVTTNWIRRDG